MDNLNGLPRLLNVRRAAELVGVKPCTIRQERLRGRLGFIKIGARIFYTEQLLKEYIEKQKVTACACDPTAQSRVKSGITGSANDLAARAPKMRGAEPSTTSVADRPAVSALAQQIFKRPASRSPNGSSKTTETPTATAPDQVLIENVLLSYWLEHAQKLPSASTAWNGLAYWQEFWALNGFCDHTQRATAFP